MGILLCTISNRIGSGPNQFKTPKKSPKRMTSATVSYESAFDALKGTPHKRMGASQPDVPPCNATPKRGRTPGSRTQVNALIAAVEARKLRDKLILGALIGV